jgi:hypothetical protein
MIACGESASSITSTSRGRRLDRPNVGFACCILIPEKQQFQTLTWVDMNFGRELIGTQPRAAVSEASAQKMVVGRNGNVFEARNADTWDSDWQPSDSRLPDPTVDYARAIGPSASAAPPQFTGNS